MRTSLTRAAAGAAVAAATVLALAGPAYATSATPLEHSTLSIVESRSVIKDGQTAIVRGRLAHDGTGEGGETVYLDHRVGTTLVDVRTGVTNASGVVAFTVEPGVTSRYELVFTGTTTLAPSHSGVVTLKVIPVAPVREHTTLSIVESKSVIKDGQTAIVRGRLAHDGTGEGGETVYLDHRVGTTLVDVRTGVTNASGVVAFTIEPGVTSRYELVFTGTTTLAPSHSGVVTLKVVAGRAVTDRLGDVTFTVQQLTSNASFRLTGPKGATSRPVTVTVIPPVSLLLAAGPKQGTDLLTAVAPFAETGDPVVLQELSGGVWRSIREHSLDLGHQASFTVRIPKSGGLEYRVVLPKTSRHGRARSNQVRVAPARPEPTPKPTPPPVTTTVRPTPS